MYAQYNLLVDENVTQVLALIERARKSGYNGLVLAEDVTSPIDLPAWDNSAMDGYALRSRDLLGKGPIPTFAPPVVPMGPVVMGDNIGAPGHVLA